jgi:tyrosine-protein kinase Etk/Wzc
VRGTTEAEISPERLPVAPEDKEISLLDVLIVLAGRKSLIIRTVLLLVLVTTGIVLLLPNKYTATTSMLPPQQNTSSSLGLLSQLGGLNSLSFMTGGNIPLKNPNDLQVALLKSQTVEDAMVDRFHLMDLYHAKRMSEARKKLENNIDIENGAKDGLIRLSVTDRSPERAAQMANAYVEEFKKFSARLAVTEASRRRLFFEQQLAQSKNDLANAEERQKKMEQTTGVLQIDAQTRAIIASVAELGAQIAAKQVQIRALRSFAAEDNPQLQVAQEELAGLEAQQQRLGASSDSSANALLIPKGKMQENQVEYVRRLRDVKYYETIFELLARQYESAKVDEARQGTEVQIVDRATVPDHHSFPKRTLLVIGAVFLGLFVGVVWALVDEAMARLSRNPAESIRLDTLRSLLRIRKRARA